MEISSSVKKPIIEESVPYGLQDSNDYLKELVQTKKIYQLSILVILSVLTIYTPYGSVVNILVGDINGIFKPIVGAIFFTTPVTIAFAYIFREQRSLLFKKVTFQLYKKSMFYALCVILFVLLMLKGVTMISSYEPNDNPILDSSYLAMVLKLPGLAIQLIGENIIFVSFLLFGYKVMQTILLRTPVLLGCSFLFAGLCFGLLHLPTYNFNWMQCVFVIGIPAISHMFIFVRYQNVHLGYWMHFNYDLLAMAFVFLGKITSS